MRGRPGPDLTGKTFHRLTVQAKTKLYDKSAWACVCECGSNVTVPSTHLTNGNTKSCGCLRQELARARMIDRNKASSNPPSTPLE